MAKKDKKAAKAGMAIVLLAMLIQGCALNPVSNRPEVTFVSLEREKELGALLAKKVEKSKGIVTDAGLTRYVRATGKRLVQYSPRQDVAYRFFVLDMAEPNAFALPGGYIYVSRGLLALVNQEDELAAALAHEIGHVAAKHAVQRVTAAVATAPIPIATGLAGAAVGILSPRTGRAVAGVGMTASNAILAPYGREQERDADQIGQDIVARAGYDPRGITTLLATLIREEKLASGGEPRPNSFLATHPVLSERMALTAAEAQTISFRAAAPIAKDQADLFSRLQGLLIGPNPDEGVFVGTRFLHPVFDFTFQYPAKWQAQNSREMVVGLSADKKALAFMQMAGKGSDPLLVARKLESKRKLGSMENARALLIGGLPAVRSSALVRASGGEIGVDFTWIAYKNRVFEIIGLSPNEYFKEHRTVYSRIARSFRPLTADDRSLIEENRLEIVRALEGEGMRQLIERVNATWSAEEAAVANGVETGAHFDEGQPVKVPVLRPYRFEN